ncbi:hypothetical protein SDC9_17674 [bioreactor metagenome]|uniref:Uncharacterized protein n=2 Tax=root TaxID=1 RepID=A0A644TY57_9ZZZZ
MAFILYIFAMNYNHKGVAMQPFNYGFFTRSVDKSGPVPPCGVLMHPLPLWCSSTGKAGPPFLSTNQYFLKMNYTENNCATCAHEPLTAESIISDILVWDKPKHFREDLRKMIDAFYLHGDCVNEDEKDSVVFTYMLLSNALDEMEQLKSQKEGGCNG